MCLSFLIVLALLLQPSAGSQHLNWLFWRRDGVETPVLVRRWSQNDVSIDPVMLVRLDNTSWMTSKHYDPIAKQDYINVPVSLKTSDNIEFTLRSEGPVKFATVTEVEASTDSGSIYDALGFVWSQGNDLGYLRLGCNSTSAADRQKVNGHVCKIDDLIRSLTSRHFAPLRRVLLKAQVRTLDDAPTVAMTYRLRLLNSGQRELDDLSVSSRSASINGGGALPDCRQSQWLKPLRAVRINNDSCSAMVYAKTEPAYAKYLVEEPICYAAAGPIPVLPDPTDQNRWNLTLRMLGGPDADKQLLKEIAEKLSKPVEELAWMRLWRAQRLVSPLIGAQFRVGQLRMPSASGSGELEVHCRHEAACRYLAAKIAANPVNFWRHIRWQTTYLAELPVSAAWKRDKQKLVQCFHTPEAPRFAALASIPSSIKSGRPGKEEAEAWKQVCSSNRTTVCRSDVVNGNHFIVVQQHQSGNLPFDRPWTDYVKGFGNGDNFWIGLTAFHLLTTAGHSGDGATLRIDMTFWNGTQGVAVYSGFKVAGPEANFSMTYASMDMDSSTVPYDSLADGKGVGFSTFDKDHDRDPGSCSNSWGRGGWWFGACYKFYPNGMYPPAGENSQWKYMKWVSLTEIVSLSFVRMMIQI